MAPGEISGDDTTSSSTFSFDRDSSSENEETHTTKTPETPRRESQPDVRDWDEGDSVEELMAVKKMKKAKRAPGKASKTATKSRRGGNLKAGPGKKTKKVGKLGRTSGKTSKSRPRPTVKQQVVKKLRPRVKKLTKALREQITKTLSKILE